MRGALPGVVESLPLKELREAGWSPRIVVAETKHRWDTRIGDGNGLELIVQGPPSGRIWDAEAFARFPNHDDEDWS